VIDPEVVIKLMVEAWAIGQCAEIEVAMDLPEQTCTVLIRRQSLVISSGTVELDAG
jgi:hypothetical protein